MRLVTYTVNEDPARLGARIDDRVIDLSALAAHHGTALRRTC
ncbi:hypothetical protein O1M54_07425 [Streptomyces diastatochromogenes]|nr:hypothetical protein [Streptomyces diastatochromogenes]